MNDKFFFKKNRSIHIFFMSAVDKLEKHHSFQCEREQREWKRWNQIQNWIFEYKQENCSFAMNRECNWMQSLSFAFSVACEQNKVEKNCAGERSEQWKRNNWKIIPANNSVIVAFGHSVEGKHSQLRTLQNNYQHSHPIAMKTSILKRKREQKI